MIHVYNIHVHPVTEHFAIIFLTHITQRIGITRQSPCACRIISSQFGIDKSVNISRFFF